MCVCVCACAYMRDDDEWTRASSLYFKCSVGMSFVVALKGTRDFSRDEAQSINKCLLPSLSFFHES